MFLLIRNLCGDYDPLMPVRETLVLALLFSVSAGCNRSARSAPPATVSAASPAAVERCAALAAHPADKKRLAEGVPDEKIIPGLAIPACQQALASDPNNPQLRFQLARALQAAGQTEPAEALFAESNYCGTGYYRAQAEVARYWQNPSSWDPIKAAIRQLEPETDCFPPSAELLGSLEFDPQDFPAPKLADALWRGQIDVLNQNRILVAHVLIGFQTQLSEMVATFDAACPARLVTQDVSVGLATAVAGDPRSALEALGYRALIRGASWIGGYGDSVFGGDLGKWYQYLEDLGRRSANRLVFASCLSPVSVEIYRGVQLFAATPRPLAEYLPAITAGRGFDLVPLPRMAPLVARKQPTQQPGDKP